MTKVITLQGRSAAVTPSELEVIQLHAQAENAMSMALHYMRQSTSNLPAANRKAVQALAALSKLASSLPANSAQATRNLGG